MFKITAKKFLVLIFALIILIPSTSVFATAHTLTPWRIEYPASSANSTYSFGFMNFHHIDGNNIKYYWDNSISKSYFNQAVTEAFSISWKNLISGTEVPNLNAAHIRIMYDPIEQPGNVVAAAGNLQNEGHYTIGNSSLRIVFYKNSKDRPANYKRTVAAHEIGHYWGIADLYNYSRSLDSIYSNIDANTSYNSVFRHDFNAMRIALNDLWFNPGGNQVWKYQPTPGTFILRGDVDQNGQINAEDARLVLRGSTDNSELTSLQTKLADVDGDGQITADDSRYVLRYSVALETKFPADIYEG